MVRSLHILLLELQGSSRHDYQRLKPLIKKVQASSGTPAPCRLLLPGTARHIQLHSLTCRAQVAYSRKFFISLFSRGKQILLSSLSVPKIYSVYDMCNSLFFISMILKNVLRLNSDVSLSEFILSKTTEWKLHSCVINR